MKQSAEAVRDRDAKDPAALATEPVPARPWAIFVSWMDHARARDLAEALGARLYVPAPGLSRAPWPLRYLVQSVLTFAFVLRTRPRHVLFTNPPFLAALPILAAARLHGGSVWCDAHSGAFNDERWRRFARANLFVLSRCAGTVLASARLQRELAADVRVRTVVVASPPVQIQASYAAPTPVIVGTLGWAWDEPIDDLLAAAKLVPEIGVTLTGRAPDDIRQNGPQNCTFSGWLPREDIAS